jgi:hypothetical protein
MGLEESASMRNQVAARKTKRKPLAWARSGRVQFLFALIGAALMIYPFVTLAWLQLN